MWYLGLYTWTLQLKCTYDEHYKSLSSQVDLLHVLNRYCSLLLSIFPPSSFSWGQSPTDWILLLLQLRWHTHLLTTAQECASSCLNTADKIPSFGTAGLECESLGATSLLTRKKMECEVNTHTHTHEESQEGEKRTEERLYDVVQHEGVAAIFEKAMYPTLHVIKKKMRGIERDLSLEVKFTARLAFQTG